MTYAAELASHYAGVRLRLNPPRQKPLLVTHVRRIDPAPGVLYVPKPVPVAPEEPPAEPPPLALAEAPRISVRAEPERFIRAVLDLLEPLDRRSIADVIRAAAKVSGLEVDELLEGGKGSHRLPCVYPRQIGMTICVLGLRSSTPRIGARFGGRDHTTVLHAVKQWRDRVLQEIHGRVIRGMNDG